MRARRRMPVMVAGEHMSAADGIGGNVHSGCTSSCASPGVVSAPAADYTCQLWSGERDSDIDAAAAALGRGEAVAFPTETVYGLGALASDDTAVAKIFAAKGRPSDNPLIVHFADGHAGLKLLAADGQVPAEAQALAEAFWPGPLSICIRANTHNVCNTCRAGLDTVAVRVPEHVVALKLLSALDRKMGKATGVAAPSANASGRPSPTEALHVLQDLGHGYKIAGVVDGGRSCSVGIESTVVDCSVSPVAILRPGKISADDIARVLQQPVAGSSAGSEGGGRAHVSEGRDATSTGGERRGGGESVRIEASEAIGGGEGSEVAAKGPKAPGMKYRHYSPRAPVVVVEGAGLLVAAAETEVKRRRGVRQSGAWPGGGPRVGIMAPLDVLQEVKGRLDGARGGSGVGEERNRWEEVVGGVVVGDAVLVKCGEMQEEWESIARDLFRALRVFDEVPSVEVIVALGCKAEGLGCAVRNRLDKAACGGVLPDLA